MEMPGALNFEVGQLAEMRSLEYGYRGAWFRCKIEDIVLEQNMILPDYYDFDPAELQWEKIYQALRYGNEKQLMVGDLVDWFERGCYWSARVIEVLSDDKVQIELLLPPSGEGGKHEAFNKDLRPFLDWSETEGWTLPTMDGQTSCYAQLIFPTDQGMDLEVEPAAATVSHVNASPPLVYQQRELETDLKS